MGDSTFYLAENYFTKRSHLAECALYTVFLVAILSLTACKTRQEAGRPDAAAEKPPEREEPPARDADAQVSPDASLPDASTEPTCHVDEQIRQPSAPATVPCSQGTWSCTDYCPACAGATEYCDGVDNDCDDVRDEDTRNVGSATPFMGESAEQVGLSVHLLPVPQSTLTTAIGGLGAWLLYRHAKPELTASDDGTSYGVSAVLLNVNPVKRPGEPIELFDNAVALTVAMGFPWDVYAFVEERSTYGGPSSRYLYRGTSQGIPAIKDASASQQKVTLKASYLPSVAAVSPPFVGSFYNYEANGRTHSVYQRFATDDLAADPLTVEVPDSRVSVLQADFCTRRFIVIRDDLSGPAPKTVVQYLLPDGTLGGILLERALWNIAIRGCQLVGVGPSADGGETVLLVGERAEEGANLTWKEHLVPDAALSTGAALSATVVWDDLTKTWWVGVIPKEGAPMIVELDPEDAQQPLRRLPPRELPIQYSRGANHSIAAQSAAAGKKVWFATAVDKVGGSGEPAAGSAALSFGAGCF